MRFAGIRPQPCRGLESSFSQREPGRSMIMAEHCVERFVRVGELALGVKKGGIAFHRFIH